MVRKSGTKNRGIGCAAIVVIAVVLAAIGGLSNLVNSGSDTTDQSDSSVDQFADIGSTGDDVSDGDATGVETEDRSTVPDVTRESPSGARSALLAAGFVVILRDSSGAPVTDPTGWTISGESSTNETVATGSTVTLTLTSPAPAPAVAPAQPADPGGSATALCNDGTLSFAAHHQGACSHHGGVATFYK